MTVLRILAAVVLTLVMLYVARTNSRGRPDEISRTINNVRFDITTVPKAFEHTDTTLTVTVDHQAYPAGEVDFRYSHDKDAPLAAYDTRDMRRLPVDSPGAYEYAVDISAGPKGDKLWYYFELTDSTGASVATLMFDDHEAFLFKSIGHVPSWILALHVLFIFATFFCVSMATIHSLRLVGGYRNSRPLGRWLLWATITCFMGMIPFGIPMNWYAFGATWEGVPFGHDATDNKTQLLFVYLLFVTFLAIGSASKQRWGRDLYSARALGWWGLSTFAVMLFIYLIPHSIQFSPGFTYAFCYTWIGIVVVLYIFSRLRARPNLQ
jgi:hypothetical protein